MNRNGPDRTNNPSLRDMDTEALRSLLIMELNAEGELNLEKIQEITDIIAEREQLNVPDVNASWEDFQNQYRSTEPLHTLDQEQSTTHKVHSKRKIFRKLFLVAAVLASLLVGATLTAQAAEYDLWGAVAQWTSETFGFAFQRKDAKTDAAEDVISPELQPLWTAMENAGISDPLLPMYLPDEYQQVELIKSDGIDFWSAAYQSSDNQLLQIQVQRSQYGTWSTLQKDTDTPEHYNWGGNDFYIMTNMGQWVAAWSNDQYEYMLSCQSKQEIYQMIESTPKEETK